MEKHGDADALLDGKPATRVQNESRACSSATALDDRAPTGIHGATARASKPLRNWRHEEFARLVVGGTEPAEAYVLAGFTRHRANHNRLIRHLKDRIEVLRRERETAARAARVPLGQVIEELDRRGFIRVDDFFERNAAGMLGVRNLEMVPVEVSIAFLKALGEGFGIRGVREK